MKCLYSEWADFLIRLHLDQELHQYKYRDGQAIRFLAKISKSIMIRALFKDDSFYILLQGKQDRKYNLFGRVNNS